MPFSTAPRPHPAGTGLACRHVVSARREGPEAEQAVLRALRLSWMCDPRAHDDPAVLAEVVRGVGGIDGEAVLAGVGDPEVEAAYEADRAEARSVLPPASAQGKTAATDGAERYTAPSLVLSRGDDPLVAAGWQSPAAYDVCIATLDPTLPQRPPAGPDEALPAFPRGLATIEVAHLMAARNETPNAAAAEKALIALVDEGRAERVPMGSDAIWLPR
jgi:hypothetical protein